MLSRTLAHRVIQPRGLLLRFYPCSSLASSSRHPGCFFSSASESSTPRRRGNLLIGLGWALLGLVAVDQALQYKQEQEAHEHRRMLYQMQAAANEENEAQWDATLPSLYKCKVSRTEVSLDGTKMLRNVGLGDVVEVLEAGIGPNQAYHLCRNPASDRPGSVGWYPAKYLERID